MTAALTSLVHAAAVPAYKVRGQGYNNQHNTQMPYMVYGLQCFNLQERSYVHFHIQSAHNSSYFNSKQTIAALNKDEYYCCRPKTLEKH